MDVYDKIMQEEYLKGQKTAGAKNAPQICPEMKGEKCKLCELCHEVFKTEKRKDSPLREKAGNYNQKKKYYSNIVFPALNPGEIRLFEYGEKIFRKLLNAQMDALSEYKGFFDYQTGRNLYIIKTPAPVKKNTNYDVEFRIQSTPIPEATLALIQQDKLYKLDRIPELIAQGVTPLKQGDLTEGRNEVRILPSWLGPKSSMFFYVMKYHFINKEEFDAIQAGRVNPFKDEIILPHPTTLGYNNPGLGHIDVGTPNNGWGEVKPASTNPLCYGSYEDGSPLCTGKCNPAIVAACKPDTLAKQQAREVASRLYPKT